MVKHWDCTRVAIVGYRGAREVEGTTVAVTQHFHYISRSSRLLRDRLGSSYQVTFLWYTSQHFCADKRLVSLDIGDRTHVWIPLCYLCNSICTGVVLAVGHFHCPTEAAHQSAMSGHLWLLRRSKLGSFGCFIHPLHHGAIVNHDQRLAWKAPVASRNYS